MDFDTTKSTAHAYEPLQGPNHIRLISLLPALRPDEAIRFSFLTGDLLELETQYEAISYTWGEPLLTFPLYVDDGTHVKVTVNLDHALRRLRLPATTRLLWADAVCIDQSNDAEKGTQIPLMTQIFRNAKGVLAWVGGGEEEEEGMRQLNMLSRDNRHLISSQNHFGVEDVAPRRPFPGPGNIRQFLRAPWFSRLWIIQEIVFNNDITLLCGSSELSWSRLCSALLITQHTRPEAVIAFGAAKVDALLKIVHLWKHHCVIDPPEGDPEGIQPENFLNIVDRFWTYQCSDPRDRIYALYSMTSDISPRAPYTLLSGSMSADKSRKDTYSPVCMSVDYSLTLCQTYVALARACIDSGRLADVLNAVFARQSHTNAPDWPSWVPDWQKAPSQNYFKLDSHIALRWKSIGSSSNPLASPTIQFDWNLIDELDLEPLAVDQTLQVSSTPTGHTFLPTLGSLCLVYSSSILAELLWVLLGRPYAFEGPLQPTMVDCARYGGWDCPAFDVCARFVLCVDSIAPLYSQSLVARLDASFPGLTEKLINLLQGQCLFIAKASTSSADLQSVSWVGFGSANLRAGDALTAFLGLQDVQGPRESMPSAMGKQALLLRSRSERSGQRLCVRSGGQYHLVGSAYISPPCKDGGWFRTERAVGTSPFDQGTVCISFV